MFKYFLKITFRNLLKNITCSFINIIGLSVGIACSILILLWVQDELCYDCFHKNADVIYRVVGDDGVFGKMSISCVPFAENTKINFSDVRLYGIQ
jgi:hypothetical protein